MIDNPTITFIIIGAITIVFVVTMTWLTAPLGEPLRRKEMFDKKVKLGDEVKDKVSGFKGIAVCKHDYLNGCSRFSIQPPVDKDGKLPDTATFDEPQLELVEKEKAEAETGSNKTGGPEKYSDESR